MTLPLRLHVGISGVASHIACATQLLINESNAKRRASVFSKVGMFPLLSTACCSTLKPSDQVFLPCKEKELVANLSSSLSHRERSITGASHSQASHMIPRSSKHAIEVLMGATK